MTATVRVALSAARLTHFRAACHGDLDHALRLYVWDAQMAAAFQAPLGQLEIVVRNAIHSALTIRAQTDQWWDANGLGVDPATAAHIRALASRVRSRSGGRLTGDDVVPRLGFGFWCKMLDHHHEDLWRRVLRSVFPHLPPGAKRADLRRELDYLREFRNRVAHLERIYHRDLVADYDAILRCIAYLSPPVAVWVDDLSRVAEVLRQRPTRP